MPFPDTVQRLGALSAVWSQSTKHTHNIITGQIPQLVNADAKIGRRFFKSSDFCLHSNPAAAGEQNLEHWEAPLYF